MQSDIEIEIKGVWKIFGDRAEEALSNIREHGISKQQVLEDYDCGIGVANVDLEIKRGEIFCVMASRGVANRLLFAISIACSNQPLAKSVCVAEIF